MVIEQAGTNLRPTFVCQGRVGKDCKAFLGVAGTIPSSAGAQIFVEKGATVYPGDVLAKIPRETTKTKDITGGLPRVAELFEARKPKEHAVVSEIDGEVSFGGFVKGLRKVVVDNKIGDVKEYFIPRGWHVNCLR